MASSLLYSDPNYANRSLGWPQQVRNCSIAPPCSLSSGTATAPTLRCCFAGNNAAAQPCFEPTWTGFLDTTRDAMMIVEAALQGHLTHISRRPSNRERAQILASGTVLVYEENASGIKRWTDAIHWSPSRVLNNYLIYRQLTRVFKHEKKTDRHIPYDTTRRRMESNRSLPRTTDDRAIDSNNGNDSVSHERSLLGNESITGGYANFAQDLPSDQQRRFCGSLVDSYQFKEGGLMKKTISVKYRGTHHHVVSYYSLEDVVGGKLKRPFQDSRLKFFQPRSELLTGWDFSLEDEEKDNKNVPFTRSCSQPIEPSRAQRQIVTAKVQTSPHGTIQRYDQTSEYRHGTHISHYTLRHQGLQCSASSQPTTASDDQTYPYQSLTQGSPRARQYVQSHLPRSQPLPLFQSTYIPESTLQQFTPFPQASQYYLIDPRQPTLESPHLNAEELHYDAFLDSQSNSPSSLPCCKTPRATDSDDRVLISWSADCVQGYSLTSLQQRHQMSAPALAARQLLPQQYRSAPPHPARYYIEDLRFPIKA